MLFLGVPKLTEIPKALTLLHEQGPKPSCFIHMSNPTATARQILVSLSLVKLHSKLIAFGSDVQINQVIAYPSGSVEKIRASNILIACIIKWLPYFFFPA